MDPFDEEWHSSAHPGADPEMLLLRSDSSAAIDRAMNHLPDRFRELLTLRELEGLSYQEIADVKGIPIGTVMSGLSRAREAFRSAVIDRPAGRDARIDEARKAGVSRGERSRPKMLALRHLHAYAVLTLWLEAFRRKLEADLEIGLGVASIRVEMD